MIPLYTSNPLYIGAQRCMIVYPIAQYLLNSQAVTICPLLIPLPNSSHLLDSSKDKRTSGRKHPSIWRMVELGSDVGLNFPIKVVFLTFCGSGIIWEWNYSTIITQQFVILKNRKTHFFASRIKNSHRCKTYLIICEDVRVTQFKSIWAWPCVKSIIYVLGNVIRGFHVYN